jgi:putative Mg2+ transporter-C (MgtC) family protein
MEYPGEMLETLFKILAAIIFGGLVGLEREHHSKAAGLRTHIILCVGATLITIVSIRMSRDLGTDRLADPTRIAANIVTGIGFLGGGAILRMGGTVRGLTTAACIWTVTGVGMAVGAGYYFAAALVVLTVLLTLHFLARFEDIFINRKEFRQVTLTARASADLLGSIEKVLADNHIRIKSIEVEKKLNEPNVDVRAMVTVPDRVNLNKLSEEIFQIPDTIHFEVE